jgi:N-acetylglucosamine malate deacetylase 1
LTNHPKNVLVVAPHPDDETLGCGGTISRHRSEGDSVHWLIVTGISTSPEFSPEAVTRRDREILDCAAFFGFEKTHRLEHPTARLDTLPIGELVAGISQVVSEMKAEVIYLPYPGDVHSDHRAVFEAALPTTKWFRYGSVKKVLAYEVPSETEFNISPVVPDFRPNIYVDISSYIDCKVQAMNIFESEIHDFPFPRSEKSIRALAAFRGSSAGVEAAEAFMLLRETV